MKQQLHATIRTVTGIFFIVFGIAGMILPILPGWWVALIGLQLLGLRLVISRDKPLSQMIRLKRKN